VKVKAPKCPACGSWMYISTGESEEERVDVPPTIFIYWTCDCSKADVHPFDVMTVLGQKVVLLRHKTHNASSE